MPLSEKAKLNQKKYQVKYKKENYKRIPLDVSVEKYDEIKTISQDLNESVNGFIKKSIDERIKQIKDHQ